jgi:hypothetical protein
MDDYLIFHDGVELPARTLVLMAMNAPDYHTAEHYLVSLLYCASIREDRRLLAKCQEIRQHFGITPYPEQPASIGNLPPVRPQEEEVRSIFNKQNENIRYEWLREALTSLLDITDNTGKNISSKKQHWMGVYLVLRDRLGIRCSQTGFADYASKITPCNCPDDLKIGSSTMTNFAKIVTEDKAYFEMKHNPFAEVCDTLWNIIVRQILTKI